MNYLQSVVGDYLITMFGEALPKILFEMDTEEWIPQNLEDVWIFAKDFYNDVNGLLEPYPNQRNVMGELYHYLSDTDGLIDLVSTWLERDHHSSDEECEVLARRFVDAMFLVWEFTNIDTKVVNQ
ncbi:MAG: hypothetical protein ACYTFW_01120 [Planctomycetota bacterium]|jgi:hypothetical protein